MNRQRWHLQILRTTWVLWGYGPRSSSTSVTHVERAAIHLVPGDAFWDLPFELPEPTSNLQPPQEYERRIGFGWRWNLEDGSARHSWRFAETVDEAIEKARDSMKHQRRDTQKIGIRRRRSHHGDMTTRRYRRTESHRPTPDGNFGAVRTVINETLTVEGDGIRVDTHATGIIEGACMNQRSSTFFPGVTIEKAHDWRIRHGYVEVCPVTPSLPDTTRRVG